MPKSTPQARDIRIPLKQKWLSKCIPGAAEMLQVLEICEYRRPELISDILFNVYC